MSPYQKKTTLILILTLIISFGFGVATMRMDENGDMSHCPLMNSAAICQMSFSEHIVIFQSIFMATPSRVVLSLILVLAFLLTLRSKPIPRIYSPPRLLLFLRNNPEPFFANKLLLALSDGILQPKLYA
ncbi:MAG: hypothetical protein Q8R55_02565 [Candidatus Taylorbacteria bacterium]|nr:hypothetical protein [Candidatus Taylorbacteria bacterium]